jgi:AcrR family transcriptional regulator
MSAGTDEPDGDRRICSATALSERPNHLALEQLPAPPQQERSRRARDALLAASLALFAENGYDGTTVDEVARRAGVAVGGFYLHFRSKRQVLLVLMDQLVLDLDSRLGAPGDTTRLPERLLPSLHFDSPHAGVYRAWREAALHDASIAAFDGEIEAWTSARISAALRTVAVKPWARANLDLHSFAWMLSVLWWRLLENLRPDRDAHGKTVVELMQCVLFEDRAPPGDLDGSPAEETP